MEEQKIIIVSDDYLRAEELHKRMKATVHSMKISFIELGKILKEMRDGKLYKELGYQNFEDYCKSEAEINRRYAYELIGIAEKLPENFVRSAHKIGVKKLSLLSMLEPEQRKEVIETVDVESVTVKELKAEINNLKQNNQKLEYKKKQSESALQKKQVEIIELEKQVQELENRPIETYHSEEDKQEIERLTVQNEALEEQRAELEQRICAYESQVQLQPEKTPQYQNLMKALHNNSHDWSEKYDALQEKSWQEMNELKRKHKAEVQALQSQIAEKSAEPEESPESRQFRIQLMTIGNSLSQLFAFLCDHPQEMFLNQSEKLCRDAENSLAEIRKQV